MSISPVELSLVVPLYNEENGCKAFAESLSKAFTAEKLDYELILVNNGSRDRTGEILRQLRQENPRIKVVEVALNEGFGWGVINGLRIAGGQHIGFMGGDEQVKPADVIRVYRKLVKEQLDLSKVKRVVRFDGWRRQIISSVYNVVFPWFFPARTADINGTPKILTASALKKVFPNAKDWFIDAEIMIKAARAGLKIGEEEIEFWPRQSGKSNVRLSTVWEFMKNFIYYKFRGLP